MLRINIKKCSTIFPPIQNDLHSCYNHMLVSTKSGSKMFLPELSKQITILTRRFKIEQYKCVYCIGCLFTLCVHCTLTVYCLFFTCRLMLVVHVGQTRLQCTLVKSSFSCYVRDTELIMLSQAMTKTLLPHVGNPMEPVSRCFKTIMLINQQYCTMLKKRIMISLHVISKCQLSQEKMKS